MDTSKLYIQMCDCPEIQKNPLPMYEASISYADKNIWVGHEGHFYYKGELWLPQQDQIQEMLDYGIGVLVNDFEEFCVCELNMLATPDDFPKSMEQLWLRFYMHEKHQKVWYGEKWVKE